MLSLSGYASERELIEIERLLAGPDPYGRYRDDPLGFFRDLWPHRRPYGLQERIALSVRDNRETFVVAAHQVGKDFVSAACALHFFLTRHPVRVIVTSVKDDHLRVFVGEMVRFIETAARPLLASEGGPLYVSHRELHKADPATGRRCPVSYLRGCVSERGEGMAGHHAEHTLFIADEASGVDDEAYRRACTWAKRVLVIGNPYGDGRNFFGQAVRGGDVPLPEGAA